MNCEACQSNPSFYCPCNSLYLCSNHLGQHVQASGSHNFENLTTDIGSYRMYLLKNELTSRIMILQNLKKKLVLETKSLIQVIEKNIYFVSKNIDIAIGKLLEKLNQKFFRKCEIIEIDKINKTKLIVSQSFLEVKDKVEHIYKHNLKVSLKYEEKGTKMNRFLEKNNSQFKCIAVSDDGKYIAAGSNDTSVRIWDSFKRQLYACFTYHKDTVNCLAFSNKSCIASGSDDKEVVLWDVIDKSIISVFRGHTGQIKFVCFCKNFEILASASDSNEIILWNIESEQSISKVTFKNNVLCGLVSSKMWLYGGFGSTYQIWDLISSQQIFSNNSCPGPILSITQSTSEIYTFTSSSDGSINIWLNSSNSLYTSLKDHKSSVISLCITPDDKFLVSGSLKNKIIIWEISSMTKYHHFKMHNASINGLAYKNDFIYSASDDCMIGISKLSTKSFEWHSNLNWFTAGTISVKDSIIVYGKDNILIICSVDSEQNFPLNGHCGGIQATCISSTLKFVLSCSWGSSGNLILWDLDKKTKMRALDGHSESVFCVDISESVEKGISGDATGVIIVWDLKTGVQEARFNVSNNAIVDVIMNKGGKYAAFIEKNQKLTVIDIHRKIIHASFNLRASKVMKLLSSNYENYFICACLFNGINSINIERKELSGYLAVLDKSKEWHEIQEDLIKNFIPNY